jgi:hypothetical protein
MSASHTQGPWTLIESARVDRPDRIVGDNGIPVASIFAPHKADTRLIAAAPDLLDALLSIAEHAREFADLEDSETMVVRMTDKASAAIAKATGGAA